MQHNSVCVCVCVCVGNKREQKREKTKKGRSKKKVSVGRRQGDRGHLLEEEEEGEGPTWTDQLHSQMMY